MEAMQPTCLMQIFTTLLIIFAIFESFKIDKETALILGIGLSAIAFVLAVVLSVFAKRRLDKYSVMCSLLVGALFVTFFSGIAFLGRATGAWSIWD